MAKESASSGGGREHTHEHAASARYEHQHPPTQLASGVGLGDSGRGKEEAPLVADDVAMDEDEDEVALNNMSILAPPQGLSVMSRCLNCRLNILWTTFR